MRTGRSKIYTEETFFAVAQQMTKSGLEVNEQKTKYMIFTKKEFKNNQSVKTGAYTIKTVKAFKYLGTL